MQQIRRPWFLMLVIVLAAGVFVGCSDDDDDDDDRRGDVCLVYPEIEPNDTELNAQVLDDMFVGDCFQVDGSIVATTDQDSYRIFVREEFILTVTLDHSTLVDLDVELFDADTGELIATCATNLVPELCDVALPPGVTVDVVVAPAAGVGPYTLELAAL